MDDTGDNDSRNDAYIRVARKREKDNGTRLFHFFSAISNKSFVRETRARVWGKRDTSPREEIASRLPAEKGRFRVPRPKIRASAYARPRALYFHLRGANFEIANRRDTIAA